MSQTQFWTPIAGQFWTPFDSLGRLLRQNWLSNRFFVTYDDIIDAACRAWNKLTAQPTLITSIGMRDWAHVGHN